MNAAAARNKLTSGRREKKNLYVKKNITIKTISIKNLKKTLPWYVKTTNKEIRLKVPNDPRANP